MADFRIDTDQLKTNSEALTGHADKVRNWLQDFDDPAFYDQYSKTTSFVGAPMAAALREHGRQTREHTELIADRIQNNGEQSHALAAEAHTKDVEGAQSVQVFK
ncbi:hypothetical protein [Mycobacteroides salmoniphilum]|uniref:Uncharacterized protein n=1 Tax=Mycobacteroides salmoniphilum TaxID=404941 RepID=A0A4R8SZZ2_9MYCO|nr:hypothetical protein [Mycobacteroides salmoniphilum]TEA09173.1 hypothetical protein CCUG60884_00342 [Mycobacteroides salmoniphilum]